MAFNCHPFAVPEYSFIPLDYGEVSISNHQGWWELLFLLIVLLTVPGGLENLLGQLSVPLGELQGERSHVKKDVESVFASRLDLASLFKTV